MESARITQWLNTLVCVLLLLKAEGNFVPITQVENAVSKGAGKEFLLFLIITFTGNLNDCALYIQHYCFFFVICLHNIVEKLKFVCLHNMFTCLVQFVWMAVPQLTTLIRDLEKELTTGLFTLRSLSAN